MNRSRKVLLGTSGVLIALVIFLIVVIALFDWNRMRPFIDDKVSAAIGRPFVINGDLTVAWQREPTQGGLGAWVPWPEFTARDVQIANPGWAKQRLFAHLDSIRFRLSPLALLAHRVTVPTVYLQQPVIDLERNKQKQATWTFVMPQSSSPSTWTLDLGAIGFDRGRIGLDDVANDVNLKLTLEPLQHAIPYDQIVAQESSNARAQAAQSDGAEAAKLVAEGEKPSGDHSEDATRAAASKTAYQFNWQANGSYQGAALDGSGRIGGVLALQDSTKPFPVQAKLTVGDSHIALVGTLTDPVHLGALDLKLWFSGSSMSKLYPLIGVTLPDTPPYATEGRLKATLHQGGSRFSYDHFRGRVGNSDLGGDLLIVTGGARPKMSGDLHSQLLRFADLAPLIGADTAQHKKQTGDTTPQPSDKALPVEEFKTDRLRAMDADVTFSAAKIVHVVQLPIDSLNTHIILNDGLLQLDPLNFGVAGGTISSALKINGRVVPMHGTLDLTARHLQLKQLFPEFKPMQTSFGEINGDADLTVKGNSVSALLGDANGEVKLLVNDGAISQTLLETAGLNIANVIYEKLFGDKTVKINCAASDLTGTHGLFTTKLFVLDTDDAIINVNGTIDFSNEKLNLDITPHTKGFRVITLRSPLYVKGTMKNPDIGVHAGPLIAKGAGAVALSIVAAPVAALLPLISPSHGDNDNTCQTVLNDMRNTPAPNPGGKKLPAPTAPKTP